MSTERHFYLPREELQLLLDALSAAGWQCLGPVEQDGALLFQPISSVEQLPRGVHDQQGPGSYRLQHDDSARYFAWANGPQALKPLTFAPEETLWRVSRDDTGVQFVPETQVPPKLAVLGVRACDLAALALQDQHFLDPGQGDPRYAARREKLFLIGVDCSHPAATCFCASTGDGPGCDTGFDLAMSELADGFVIRAGSHNGEVLLAQLSLTRASDEQREQAAEQLSCAAQKQQRTLPEEGLRDAFYARQEHPHWQAIAQRCLACGNCTAVCPSCFCSAYEAKPSLTGEEAEHRRIWDSCFSAPHSELHGHALRDDIRLRYRQWLTHKLAGWHDQYGRSGCTGCGRCISWCPVGIDLTAEVAALLQGGEHDGE